jgi:hypothetical protein
MHNPQTYPQGPPQSEPLAPVARLGEDRAMRLRILAGTVFLILGLALYAAVVVAIVARLLPNRTLIDMALYAAAGIIWIWPAARLTRWMNRAAPHHPPPGVSI